MTEPGAAHALLNPADSLPRQHEKLLAIVDVLMRRVEQATDRTGAGYAQFERAAILENQVRARTRDLESALDLLNEANARLAAASAESALARRNLTDALEAVQEGFGLFGPDDVLVLANSRFGAQLPDIQPALVPGLGFAAYVDHVSRAAALVLPQGMSAQDWALQRLLRHREQSVVFTVELTGDRWLQVSEHRTPAGGTVILQTDVTEILRAERAARGRLLDDQARLVRATLDHISQGVCIFDAEARLAGWNTRAAELMALGRGRFRAGVGFTGLAEQIARRLAEPWALAPLVDWVASPAPRPPLRFEWRRGADTVLDGFAQQMPDGGFVVSLSDVSAERRAIAALSRANETLEARVAARTRELDDALKGAERANATRSRFVAAASHDLLQPLSAAGLFLASMADDPLPPRALEALGKAQSALRSIETLLGALLDISRLESGKLSVSFQDVPLAPLLTRVAQEFEPLAAAKGLTLRVRPGHGTAWSDPVWLRRMLQNLISNAVRYTDRGGVLVGIRHGAAGLRIDVIDSGPGIPPEESEAIFREFHRLNARASAAEGMGLGLAIVERAAALLGHSVTLRSIVGRGTRFVLHLGPQRAAPDAPDPVPLALPARPDGDLIGLLVASDAGLRRALAHLLEGWGVNVLDSPDVGDASALLADIGIAPDFVLIDAAPGLETDALADARALLALCGTVPLRILSATRDEALRQRARAMGAPLMVKPVDPRQIEFFLADLPRG